MRPTAGWGTNDACRGVIASFDGRLDRTPPLRSQGLPCFIGDGALFEPFHCVPRDVDTRAHLSPVGSR